MHTNVILTNKRRTHAQSKHQYKTKSLVQAPLTPSGQ